LYLLFLSKIEEDHDIQYLVVEFSAFGTLDDSPNLFHDLVTTELNVSHVDIFSPTHYTGSARKNSRNKLAIR